MTTYTNKFAVLADLQETREMVRIYIRQKAPKKEIDALKEEVQRLKAIHTELAYKKAA